MAIESTIQEPLEPCASLVVKLVCVPDIGEWHEWHVLALCLSFSDNWQIMCALDVMLKGAC